MPLEFDPKELVKCMICGRHFKEGRIYKHQEICKKSLKIKRKPFDSFKQRIRGTSLENHEENIKKRLQCQTAVKMNHGNWRKAHEEFISTIKAVKRSQKSSTVIEKPDLCTGSMTKHTMPAI